MGQAAAAGLEFKKVSKTDGEYSILSGSDGLITLRLSKMKLQVLQKMQKQFFLQG